MNTSAELDRNRDVANEYSGYWLKQIAVQLTITNEREAEKEIARIEAADFRVLTGEKRELQGALRAVTNQLRLLAADEQVFGTIGRKLLLDLANEADKL